MSSEIRIACSSDIAYAPHCAAMLHSVLVSQRTRPVSIYYLHGPEFPDSTQNIIATMVRRFGGRIDFVRTEDERIDDGRIAVVP